MPDAYIDAVVALYPMDVDLVDRSWNDNGLTLISGAVLDASAAKFGANGLDVVATAGAAHAVTGDTPDFGFGTAIDFTVEGWFKFDSLSGDVALFDFRSGATGNLGSTIFLNGSGSHAIAIWDQSTLHGNSGAAPATAAWTHIAVAREGATTRAFIGGNEEWSTASSIDFGSTSPLSLGAGGAGTQAGTSPLLGDIDEVRVTLGVARYTASFTPPIAPFDLPPQRASNQSPPPPTRPDPDFASVTSLLHLEGVEGATTFVNEVGTDWVGEPGAELTIDRADFGESCLNSTAADAALTRPGHTFGTAPFTIEFSCIVVGTGDDYSRLFHCTGVDSDLSSTSLIINVGDFSTLRFDGRTVSGALFTTATNPVPNGEWGHYAVVRDGTSLKCFVEGRLLMELTIAATAMYDDSGGNFVFGANTDGSRAAAIYVDEVRITEGVARYSEEFVPLIQRFADSVGGEQAPVPTLFLDPANKSGDIILSNSGLTAASIGGGNWKSARSTQPRSQGKWVFECTCIFDSNTGIMASMGRGSASVNNYVGASTDGWAIRTDGFSFFNGGLVVQTGFDWREDGGFPTIMVGIDFDTGEFIVWHRSERAIAHTGLAGEILWPWVGIHEAGQSLTINLGATPFVNDLPTGFSSWDGSRIADPEVDPYFSNVALLLPFNEAPIPSADPYIANTAILLHFDEASGEFTNSGAADVTIVGGAGIDRASVPLYGNSGEGTTTEALAVTGDVVDLSSVDFTLEVMLRLDTQPTVNTSFAFDWGGIFGSTYTGYNLAVVTSGQLTAGTSTGTVGSFVALPLGTLTTGVWTHFAWVRVGGEDIFFLAGIEVARRSQTAIGSAAPAPLYIFDENPVGPNRIWLGALDEFRLTIGVGRYTENFTPPAAPFPDQPLPVTAWQDLGPEAYTAVADGDAVGSDVLALFGNNVNYQGSGRVDVPSGGDMNLTGMAFTVEAWAIIEGDTVINQFGRRNAHLCGPQGQGSTLIQGWDFVIIGDGSTTGTGLTFSTWQNSSNGFQFYNITTPISQNVWHHYAYCREAEGTEHMFIDGIRVPGLAGPIGGAGQDPDDFGLPFQIGASNMSDEIDAEMIGRVEDVRVTKFVARYTEDFIPAPYAFGTDVPVDEHFASVWSLVHFDELDGATALTDEIPARIWTFQETAQIGGRGWAGRYGGACLDVTGNPVLSNINTPGVWLDTMDWTIEFSIYRRGGGSGAYARYFHTSGGDVTFGAIEIVQDNNDVTTMGMGFANAAGSQVFYAAMGTIPQDEWVSIAVERQGAFLNFYIDGVRVLHYALPGGEAFVFYDDTGNGPWCLGGSTTGATRSMNTIYDEFRVTLGVARYA